MAKTSEKSQDADSLLSAAIASVTTANHKSTDEHKGDERDVAASAIHDRAAAIPAKTIREHIAAAPSLRPAPPRAKVKITDGRLTVEGNLYNKWVVRAQNGHLPVDMLDPDYWSMVALRLRPYDQITAIAEDGSWLAQFIVLASDKQWTKVRLLQEWDLTAGYADMPKTLEDEYDITYTVGSKWGVVKKSQHGQPPIKANFESRLEAATWLDGHLKTLNS